MTMTPAEKLWFYAGPREGGAMSTAWNQWQQPEGGVDEAEYPDYAGWTKDELAAELEKRGLTKSGNKDELIARLQEDDTA